MTDLKEVDFVAAHTRIEVVVVLKFHYRALAANREGEKRIKGF